MPRIWPRACGALLLVLATGATLAQADVPVMLQLSGACAALGYLNGLVYELQGTSSNGSPYYKARGKEEYLYYDADCDGGGDGMPRWILDTDKPVMGKLTDLDDDHACVYHARTNHFDGSKPPLASAWKMKCGEGWVNRFVTFVAITTTSTQTTTTISTTTVSSTLTSTTATSTTRTTTQTETQTKTRTTTSTQTATTTTATSTTATTTVTTRTSTETSTDSTTSTTSTQTGTETATETNTSTTETTTQTTLTTTSAVETLVLEGACRFKSFLNGLRFQYQGVGANGAPWYKAAGADQYIYYDVDCNGGGDGIPNPRWIIDEDEPNATLLEDLDQDEACDYHARLESDNNDGSGPPASAEWRMFCGEGWESLQLSLRREGEQANQTEDAPEVLYLHGACEQRDYLNDLAFTKEGVTVSGAPFYKAVGLEQYVYHDPSCDGDDATPRWIIDSSAPNASLEMDLDADGVCDYIARYSSGDISRPPHVATWRMYCGFHWRDVVVTFDEEAPTTTTGEPRVVISRAAGAAGARYLPALAAALISLRTALS